MHGFRQRGEMRKVLGLVISVLVVLLAAGCDGEVQKRPQMPNILFILTDDLDDDSESIAHMENLRSLITNRGMTLENAYVTQSLCCPSRASILRGQYPHNTSVTTNRAEDYAEFVSSGREASTFATWIHDAGYQTAYLASTSTVTTPRAYHPGGTGGSATSAAPKTSSSMTRAHWSLSTLTGTSSRTCYATRHSNG